MLEITAIIAYQRGRLNLVIPKSTRYMIIFRYCYYYS